MMEFFLKLFMWIKMIAWAFGEYDDLDEKTETTLDDKYEAKQTAVDPCVITENLAWYFCSDHTMLDSISPCF